MEEKEPVEQLQSQMADLERQLQAQYAQLQQMKQQLQKLSPEHYITTTHNQQKSGGGSLENFIGLRLMHLVGIVVLVIGLSIGVKYAFDRDLISEVARIVLAFAAGLALLLVAWRLRNSYAGFSAILFSGAMATFYFTSYASHVYYGLLPFGAVFLFMVLLTVCTAWQAVRYNRAEIALLGLVGAYGIPFLISRNAERADLFFLYIAIINLGVLYLRLKKNWALVGHTAQILTWILFIGWSATRYQAPQQGLAMVFLAVFFLLFTAMNMVKAIRSKSVPAVDVQFQLLNNVAGFVAAIFVFAPLFAVRQMAPVALGCALLAGVQAITSRQFLGDRAYFTRVLLMLSVALLVLAVALYFDGVLVTIIWLLLSVGFFALGVWRKAKNWRMASLGLMALTLLKLLVVDSQRFTAGQKVAAYLSLGLLLLVVSFCYQKFRQRWFEE